MLPLNTDDDDDANQESDTDSSSIDSDIEVNDTDLVNNDFIRLNLSNDDDSNEDEIDNLFVSTISEEIICIDPTLSSSST